MPAVVIPLDDRGLTLGDGLFETLLARDGAFCGLGAHLDRMTAGCAVLRLPPPDRDHAERLMVEALADAKLQQGTAAVRLSLTAGSGGRGLDRPASIRPRLFATATPYVRPRGPVRLQTSEILRNPTSPASRLKTLAYLDNVVARTAAQDSGADEALMLEPGGVVACATAANVFWLRDGRLFTPSLDCAILPGVVRGEVIAAAFAIDLEVSEAAFSVEQMRAAEAVFLTNSLMGLREVASWDGKPLAPSRLATLLAARLD